MFKRNFLTNVVLRIDFAEPVNGFNSEYFQKFKDNFKNLYSDVEFQTRLLQSVELNFTDEQAKNNIKTIGNLGIFKFTNNKQTIEFDPMHFTLDRSDYTNFPEFIKTFEQGLGIIKVEHKIPEIKRVGLRFINIIKDESIKEIVDWPDYINESYLPKFDYTLKPITDSNYTLRRNINDFYFSDGDFIVHLRLGIWNANFPSIITDNEFVVDIDCFSTILTNDEVMLKKVANMDHAAFKLFDHVIKEKMKNLMGKD